MSPYQIQVLRDSEQGWIPAVVDPVSYQRGERWYDDEDEAIRDSVWLRSRLTWAEVRVVQRGADGAITEVKP
jgi:hypothetical protein